MNQHTNTTPTELFRLRQSPRKRTPTRETRTNGPTHNRNHHRLRRPNPDPKLHEDDQLPVRHLRRPLTINLHSPRVRRKRSRESRGTAICEKVLDDVGVQGDID